MDNNMNRFRLVAAAAVAALATTSTVHAAAVAVWNFNDSNYTVDRENLVGTPTMTTTIAANFFSGTTIGADSSDAAGQAFGPQGNAGGVAGGANQNGMSVVFALDTTGFQNLKVSYATQRTTSGFNFQQWAYSIDGTSFTDFADPVGPPNSFALRTVDFSTIAGLNNNPNAKFRFTLTGATSANGNNRIDNLVFDAVTAVTNAAPSFASGPYSATVDVSGPGLESVPDLNASASDADTANTVTVSASNLPSFLSFSTTPGNPANFSIVGNRGLTYADVGTYTIDLSAVDGVGGVTNSTYVVNVVPEPTALAGLASLTALMLRRRK